MKKVAFLIGFTVIEVTPGSGDWKSSFHAHAGTQRGYAKTPSESKQIEDI